MMSLLWPWIRIEEIDRVEFIFSEKFIYSFTIFFEQYDIITTDFETFIHGLAEAFIFYFHAYVVDVWVCLTFTLEKIPHATPYLEMEGVIVSEMSLPLSSV